MPRPTPQPVLTDDGFACPCGFTSTGWPSKAGVKRRAAEHVTEHRTGEPMPELADHNPED